MVPVLALTSKGLSLFSMGPVFTLSAKADTGRLQTSSRARRVDTKRLVFIGCLLSLGRDEPVGGWRTSLHDFILLVFRFFQQTLGGKIIAQGQGAEQLPRRLPREPHKVSRRLTGLLDYRSYCIKNSPTGQGHLIGKEGHIPPPLGGRRTLWGVCKFLLCNTLPHYFRLRY